MYDYYPPAGYQQWTPSLRRYSHPLYSGTPLPYGQPSVYDAGYYDPHQPYYIDYNGMTAPYPGIHYSRRLTPHWSDLSYGRPYTRGGLFGSLFGSPGRRRASSYSKFTREQLQEEQLRQLRRQSNGNYKSSSSQNQRHHHNDGKKRV